MKSVIVVANAPIDVAMNDAGYCICERHDTETYRPYSRRPFTSASLRLQARHHPAHEQSSEQNEHDGPHGLPAKRRERSEAREMAAVNPEWCVEQARERLHAQRRLQPVGKERQRNQA